MLFLHKLLPLFVLPLGWVILFLGVAIWLRRRWPMIVALVVLYVASNGVIGDLLLHRLERKYSPVPVGGAAVTDAVVVLSGMLGPAINPGYVANMGEAGERFEAGIALFQAKKATWLVLTGGRLPWNRTSEMEGVVLRRLAIKRGIPEERILVTGEVGNTADEARLVKEMSVERGMGSILLVTTAWHMPRAVRLFTRAGVSVIPFPTDYRCDRESGISILDFFPTAGGLSRTEMALREWYGIAYYAIRGK